METETIKVIIAGSRYYNDYNAARERLLYFLSKTQKKIIVVSGRCTSGRLTFIAEDGTKVFGADGLGERFAKEFGYEVIPCAADWDKYGQKAGPIRNGEMAKIANALVAFLARSSRGTRDMIRKAKNAGLNVRVIPVP